MKYLLLYTALVLSSITPVNSQIIYSDTVYARYNIQGDLKSGFYYATPDTSKSGFKVYNNDKYYFIGKAPVVTMEEVDTIYKQYQSFMQRYVLIFKFNKKATKNWSDFTERYQNREVALFLRDTLVFVATVAGQITNGTSWLAGDHSEKELDDFKAKFEKEIRKAKNPGLTF